jgi:hypothetical protein
MLFFLSLKTGMGIFMAYLIDGASTPNTVNSSVARTREYLTGKEVEKLMEAARKSSRAAAVTAASMMESAHSLRRSIMNCRS